MLPRARATAPYRRPTPRSLARRVAMLVVVALAGHAGSVAAQAAPAAWQVTAEVAGAFGGTWMEGAQAPTVRTDPGVTVGVGAFRRVAPGLTAGIGARVGAQPVSVREHGQSWNGGTLTTTDLLGLLSIESAQGTPLRPSFDIGGGLAVLSGARSILPFRDASHVAPIAEAGVTIRREATPKRREMALFVRVGMLRLDAATQEQPDASGWVRHLRCGLRVTR